MRKLLIVALILAAGTLTAHADTVFNLYVDFPDNIIVKGTLTIDLATGVVTNEVAHEYYDSTYRYDFDNNFEQYSGIAVGGPYTTFLSDGPLTLHPISFEVNLPVASLVDYPGSDICSYANASSTCGNAQLWQQGEVIDVASTGYIEPATSPVPEPSTLALLGTGLLAAAGVAGRRFVRT